MTSQIEQRIDSLEARVKALEMCQETPAARVPGPGVYALRNGGAAYVYTIKGQDPDYPVVGEYRNSLDEEVGIDVWTEEGRFYRDEIYEHDILPERKLS